MYEEIKRIFFSSLLLILIQAVIIWLLKNKANKKEDRFKQTRLVITLFMYLVTFITFISIRRENITNRALFNFVVGIGFSAIIIGLVSFEMYIRKVQVEKKTKKEEKPRKSKFFEKIKLLSLSSLFYEENENKIIKPKKITNILRSAVLTIGVINCIYTTLIPVFAWFNLLKTDFVSLIIHISITTFLTEFYLFLSQKEMTAQDVNEDNELLKKPDEWSKDISKKYGTEIIAYSNTKTTNQKENCTTLENLEALSRDIMDGENILISNSSIYETKAIYYNVINRNFINKKATLIIYEDIPSLKEAEKVINSIIEEYNNELIAKVVSKFQSPKLKIDKDINIYLTTVQELLEANIKYENIQTVIINNVDKIIERNPNELYVLSTTLKNSNSEHQYILLSFVTEALRIAVRNIILVDKFKEYQINRKKPSQNLSVQVLRRNANNIKNHKSNSNHMNDLIKLAIETYKYDVDNIEIVSKKVPIQSDVEKFAEVRAKRDETLTNNQLNKITSRIKVNSNNLFQETASRKMFIKNDDEKNLLHNINSYSELNTGETYLGVVASNYLLREFIISEYLKKTNNNSDLDIIIPQTMQNDAKILLGALLLQMLNTPVKEETIIRRLKENNDDIILIEGYNKLNIVTAINSLIEKEFGINTDITSYLIESADECGRKQYMLNNNLKLKLPKDLYEKSKIILSGYEQEHTSQRGYEIYQKYIPGQVHLIENKVYKIEEIDDLDIEVSNISAEFLRKYKQDVEVNLSNMKKIEKEEELKEYFEATIKKEILFTNMDFNTLGYYEFLDSTTLEDGAYIYRKLTLSQKQQATRKYYNTRVIKLQITPKNIEMQNLVNSENHDKLAYTLSFLVNEIFETLLDENSAYVTAKAIVSNKEILNNEEVKLYRPIIDKKVDMTSISLYIIEDLKISKGLLSTIDNEIPRILTLIKKYLNWHGTLQEEDAYIKQININNTLMLEEINKIIPNIF